MPKYAATVISGDLGEADVLSGKQVRDVTKGFFRVKEKVNDFPVLAMQQAGVQGAGIDKRGRNIKKEWTTKDHFPRWDTVSAITSGNGTATIVLTPTSVDYYRTGSVVVFYGGSGGSTKYGVVTAVSTTITVESYDGTTLPTLSAGNSIFRYADSFTELSTLPTPKNVQDVQLFNYFQFMRAPVTIGLWEKGTEQYTGTEEAERREEQDLEIRKSAENVILWGERGKKTISGNTAGFTRGIGRWTEILGGDNVLTWDGVNLTQATWDDWLMEATKYTGMNAIMPISGTLFRKIHSFGETKERLNLGETAARNRNRALGINYLNYTTPEGKILRLLRHPGMEEQLEGWGQIIDLSFVDLLAFADHQLFEYHEGVQDDDLAGVSNEFWFIGCVIVRRSEVNALIKVA